MQLRLALFLSLPKWLPCRGHLVLPNLRFCWSYIPTALDASNERIWAAMQCPMCGLLDDEEHALFHCVLYRELRTQFSDLFSVGNSLKDFLHNEDVAQLAEFVFKCYRKRKTVSAEPQML